MPIEWFGHRYLGSPAVNIWLGPLFPLLKIFIQSRSLSLMEQRGSPVKSMAFSSLKRSYCLFASPPSFTGNSLLLPVWWICTSPVDGSWAALRHSKLWYVCPSRGKMLLWRCLGPSPRLGFGFWRHETSHPDRCMHVRFASCPCASWLCTVI